ncbi:MAG: polymorphic toxin type 44 domain-containing protein [Candidatus Thiodiazotropha sp.]
MSVETAVTQIRKDLTQNWQDWDVTHDELQDITKQLSDLKPSERNEVISRMSNDELHHWANETTGLIGSLSSDERNELLNMLARSLDGEQSARIAQAFGVDDMARAVAAQSSPGQKRDFIQAMQSQADGSEQVQNGFFSLSSRDGNDAARGIATVLGSMGNAPSEFSSAVAGLKQTGKLDDIMQAAAGATTTTYTSMGSSMVTPITTFDAAPLQAILSAAQGTDLTTRQSVFEAAMPALADMQNATSTLTDPTGGNAGVAQTTADAMGHVLSRNEAEAAGLLNVPVMPSSVSMDDNIRLSQHHGFPPDYLWFKGQVENKGPWDFKQQGAQYQDFGNYHYGLMAAAMGIPENIALRAAGSAQILAGTNDSTWGNPLYPNGGPYGDDPQDQAQIKAGYDYYNSGLWRVWPD